MRFTQTLVMAATFGLCGFATASDVPQKLSLHGTADRCYEETIKAVTGTDPDVLTTAPCRRALKHKPLSRTDKSAILHNQGIIEQAIGNLAEAKSSFERAVKLSNQIDSRNLALAQLAFKLGDFAQAVQQYDLLTASDFDFGSEELEAIILRNQERAMRAHRNQRVAAHRIEKPAPNIGQ